MRCYLCVAFISLSIVITALLVGCGGSGGGGTVNTSISDPATCTAPSGPYSHIYVTVTDVKIHESASAESNDSGWQDLTEGLSNNPVQVDLLGIANQCFLAKLGSKGIPAGKYQQIRIFLADDSVNVPGNKCGSTVANCVVLATDPANPLPLLLSSETHTGLKIPSGQIAGGSFVIGSGETKDLNIDINGCASLVVQGNKQYRLKPVLHAGELELQSASTAITGTVIDNTTKQPIVGANIVVALEQNDNGVDRVVMETVTGSNGTFSFCPVTPGAYDVVVSAYTKGNNVAYAATVITGVHPGDSLGTIPVTSAGAPALISGEITSSTGSVGTVADLSVSALQPLPSGLLITTPLARQSEATDTDTTAADPACPNIDCTNYQLYVPAANPAVGAFQSGQNQSPGAASVGAGNYNVDAIAYAPGSSTTFCSPSNQKTPTPPNTLVVGVGGSVAAQTLAFNGCQ